MATPTRYLSRAAQGQRRRNQEERQMLIQRAARQGISLLDQERKQHEAAMAKARVNAVRLILPDGTALGWQFPNREHAEMYITRHPEIAGAQILPYYA